MPTYYHNAENALNRSNEFCEIGKDSEALECLYDALKNRKAKMFKEVHEKIVYKFLELCVELKKSQMAKDGLYSYRNICQHVNLKSWEDAIHRYIYLAECKVENAEEKFQSVILDIDDLDQNMTPEILLKAVCSEGAQDRSERIILLPWLKLLWECYRNCLDLLKSPQTEKLYHTVAQNAFKFCVKYSRRSELRKLCNVLRIHAVHIQKRQASLNTEDAETQIMCLETGFIELESAMNMELWQDAFKAVENIHSVISISKKFQHSRILAHYYDKVSCVFLKGGEYLFHAAASLRYFQIVKDQKKNLSTDDIMKLACRILLSILAIPLPPVDESVNLVAETDVSVIDKNNLLLSSLLFLHKCPTRVSLIKDAVGIGIILNLPKEFKELFQGMEHEIEPSKVHLHIAAVHDYIKNWSDCDLEQYLPLVQKVAVVKLLPVLFNMYVNIKMSNLLKFTGISDVTDLEIILVDSARKYNFPLRIDQRNMCVHFLSDFNVFQSEKFWNESETKYSNPHLSYLMHTHRALKKAVEQINPDHSRNENKLIAKNIAGRYMKRKEIYRQKILLRKTMIEKHKEHIENLRIQKEKEEKRLLADKLLEYETAEKERLLKETEERNIQRIRREQEDIKRKILLEKMEALKKTILGSQTVENVGLDDLDNFDPQILFSKQIEQLNRERKELTSKLRRQERSFDHVERAKRVEEIPLLVQEYNNYKENDEKTWCTNQRNKLETACKVREMELQKKNKLLTVKEDLQNFLKLIKKKRFDAYNQEMEANMKTLREEKQKRLKERAEKRKKERKNQWEKLQAISKKEKQKQTESNKLHVDDLRDVENKQKRRSVNEYLKNPFTCSQKIMSSSERSDLDFPENVRDTDANPLYPTSKRSKEFSSEIFDATTNLIKDSYYYKTAYKSHAVDEIHERTSSRLDSKYRKENYRPSYHGSSNYQERISIFEKKDKIPSSSNTNFRSFPYANPNHRSIKEETFTIMQRRGPSGTETSIVDPNSKDSPSDDTQKTAQTDVRKSDAQHSCTPWAKQKRKEQ